MFVLHGPGNFLEYLLTSLLFFATFSSGESFAGAPLSAGRSHCGIACPEAAEGFKTSSVNAGELLVETPNFNVCGDPGDGTLLLWIIKSPPSSSLPLAIQPNWDPYGIPVLVLKKDGRNPWDRF